MRTRIFVDGKPAWSENVPSEGRIERWSLGGPIEQERSQAERDRATKRESKRRTREAQR